VRPSQCGDTVFADTNAAFDALPDDLRAELNGRTGKYFYLKLRDIDGEGKAHNLAQSEVASAASCATHPLITTHPITGRRNIYANPSHTVSVVGLEAAASEELLQRLFAQTA
jgi:taurine dioxygenase